MLTNVFMFDNVSTSQSKWIALECRQSFLQNSICQVQLFVRLWIHDWLTHALHNCASISTNVNFVKFYFTEMSQMTVNKKMVMKDNQVSEIIKK